MTGDKWPSLHRAEAESEIRASNDGSTAIKLLQMANDTDRNAGLLPRRAKPTIERLVDYSGISESNINHAMTYEFAPVYRHDDLGRLRLMASAEGYVMVRRPGALPFLMTVKEWADLSDVAT